MYLLLRLIYTYCKLRIRKRTADMSCALLAHRLCRSSEIKQTNIVSQIAYFFTSLDLLRTNTNGFPVRLFNVAVHELAIYYSLTRRPDGQGCFGTVVYWMPHLILQIYRRYASQYVNNSSSSCEHAWTPPLPTNKPRVLTSTLCLRT